jgi:hypothetical protein
VHRYLDTLAAALVLWQLPPWFENPGKRQVKAPKIYVADSGLLHTLLGVETAEDLERHPKIGASWEGFAMGEVMTRLSVRPEQCFFWATHTGAEVDLLVGRGSRRWGFECKRTVAPRLTRSIFSRSSKPPLFKRWSIHFVLGVVMQRPSSWVLVLPPVTQPKHHPRSCRARPHRALRGKHSQQDIRVRLGIPVAGVHNTTIRTFTVHRAGKNEGLRPHIQWTKMPEFCPRLPLDVAHA